MASLEPNNEDTVAPSSETSFAESAVASKVPLKKEKPDKGMGTPKLKKSIMKQAKSKDVDSNGIKTAGTTRSPSPESPSTEANPSKTDGDRPGTTQCKHCKKPVENAHFQSHSTLCLEQKKANAKKKKEAKEARSRAKEAEEKDVVPKEEEFASMDRAAAASANGTEGKDTTENTPMTSTKKPPPKKSAPSATKTDGSTKKTKKRKAEDEGAEKEPKKKKTKKEPNAGAAGGTPSNEPPKPKITKPKGPVNVELQCGVALPNGGFCARSLTCKSHSMGAKRSVPGRSAPYDQLLQQYQKKNQAKQQKALLASQVAADGTADGADADGDGATIDSDEERDGVMKGIARGWGGRRLDNYTVVPTKSRYKGVRIKEMVQGAIAGGKLFAATYHTAMAGTSTSPPIGGPEVEGEVSRKGSVNNGGGPKGVAQPVRKASVASSGGG